ncbi:hypothetical protein MMC17_004673 [Xylographa soralifera]|nr:hypothetical protein [Xylographa soralifera]
MPGLTVVPDYMRHMQGQVQIPNPKDAEIPLEKDATAKWAAAEAAKKAKLAQEKHEKEGGRTG